MINLEQELIKQNKKLATPKELLVINEYEKHTDLVENDALLRVGLNYQVKLGKEIKNRIIKKNKETEKYNQERVFHISQIESICNKYYLRFLPSFCYKGTIDSKLPEKISTFELAYGETININKSFIMAPKESFKLQEKPKDPLFFFKINEEYFYLIHKWGNDLSSYRSIFPYFSSSFISMLIIAFIFPLPLFLIHPVAYTVPSALIAMFCTFYNSIEGWSSEETLLSSGAIRLLPKNKWNDRHK